MDALLPLASLPAPVGGRNRLWRKMVSDAIRTDPEWKGGAYTSQPRGLLLAAEVFLLMSGSSVLRHKEAPTPGQADELLEAYVAEAAKKWDANDVLYAVESSRDYDPGPGLEKVRAPLWAINFADDLINPPELGILEEATKRVPKGKAITYPLSDQTSGHGTHTNARVWKEHLEALMKETEPKTN